MSTCIRCNEEMTTTEGSWDYVECGLDNVRLENVEIHACAACGNRAVVLPNIEGLHAAIAAILAAKPGPLEARELRFMRQYLGYARDDLAPLLQVSVEDLDDFEQGSRQMPPLLERFLRLSALTKRPVALYPPERLPVAAAHSRNVPLSMRHQAAARKGASRAQKDHWVYDYAS